MTPDEARHIINTEGRRHVLLAYFTKKNGQVRRMLFIYDGASSPRPHLMCVHDIEKGAPRMLNLKTLTELRVLKSRVRRAADRPPQEPGPKPAAPFGSYEEAKAAMDELFY